MAADFAQIRTDMWSDDDWRACTMPAQWLYMALMTHGTRNYAGVAEWHPGRLSKLANELTPKDVFLAGAELAEGRFIAIDEESEEVGIRSFIRHDGLMKNPRLAVSVAKAYASTASNLIRGMIVHEVGRLRKENPNLPAWDKPQVKTLLKQNAIDIKSVEVDLPIGLGVYLPNGLGVTLGSINPGPTTATATATTTATSSNEDALFDESSSPQGVRGSSKSAGQHSRRGAA